MHDRLAGVQMPSGGAFLQSAIRRTVTCIRCHLELDLVPAGVQTPSGLPAVHHPACTTFRVRDCTRVFLFAGVQSASGSMAAQLAFLQSAMRRTAAPLAVFAAAELRSAAVEAIPQQPPPQPMVAPYVEGAPQYCSAAPLEPGNSHHGHNDYL